MAADQVARRRAYQAGGRPVRLSVTLTEDERRRLGQLAAQRGVSVATLLVQAALSLHRPDSTDAHAR